MSRRGERRWGRARRIAPAALLTAAIAAPVTPATGKRIDAGDRDATYAYLRAIYDYQTAEAANAPASTAAFQALGERLSQECPGVMKSAPQERSPAFGPEGPETAPPSARRQGEEKRVEKQRDAMMRELSFALFSAERAPNRTAEIAFASALHSLHWRDQALTSSVHLAAAELEAEWKIEPPDVCPDMQAWAASGFKALSPATKAFLRAQEAAYAPALRQAEQRMGNPFAEGESLSRYEGPREKALVRKINALRRRRVGATEGLLGVEERVHAALGIVEAHIEPPAGPPKDSVVIAHGKTAVGSHYTIRLTPKQSHSRPGGGGLLERSCSGASVSVETRQKVDTGLGEIVVENGSEGNCLERSHPEPVTVRCNGGLLEVEGQTRPRARTVRLRLSNGRAIVSRVAVIPAHMGGPVGVYYQTVRGPSPIPVSLIELDAHGKALHTIELNRVHECTAIPIHYLPGGIRTLVHSNVPGGPRFSILAKHYRSEGHLYFKLSLQLEDRLEGNGNSAATFGETSERGKPQPFDWQMNEGCNPHEYTIVFGVLKAPPDTVLALIGGTWQTLHKVRIPASFHAGGQLAYIALASAPTELVVRGPSGKTVFKEDMSQSAHETAERCAGEAEG